MKKDSYLLVSTRVLPSVFEGVITAKELLATGKATSAAAATKAAGISRSAFYKYKDFVFKYSAENTDTLSINALLTDRAGVLSALTAALYDCGANIITVSQETPENGTAKALLTVNTENMKISAEELIERLLKTDGIISIKTIDGGKR